MVNYGYKFSWNFSYIVFTMFSIVWPRVQSTNVMIVINLDDPKVWF
jgi:hypothetical protein